MDGGGVSIVSPSGQNDMASIVEIIDRIFVRRLIAFALESGEVCEITGRLRFGKVRSNSLVAAPCFFYEADKWDKWDSSRRSAARSFEVST